MIVRALGVELILDVDSSYARANEFPHGAHGVHRLAEARPAVGEGGNFHRVRDVSRHVHLLAHRHHRLGDAARTTRHETTRIGRLEAQALHQPAPDGIVGDGHEDKISPFQQGAELGGVAANGHLHLLYGEIWTSRILRSFHFLASHRLGFL